MQQKFFTGLLICSKKHKNLFTFSFSFYKTELKFYNRIKEDVKELAIKVITCFHKDWLHIASYIVFITNFVLSILLALKLCWHISLIPTDNKCQIKPQFEIYTHHDQIRNLYIMYIRYVPS